MLTPSEQEEFEFRLRAEREANQNQPNIQDRSKQFGSITKTPTMLERIGTNLTSQKTRPIGILGGLGVLSSSAGIPEENLLPAIGQGIGGSATGFTGSGLLGATAGGTIGEGLKQSLKSLRGEQPDFSTLPREALTTGAIEGATRGLGHAFFPKQIANETLNTLGKELGAMKERIANSEGFVRAEPIAQFLEQGFNSLPDPLKSGKAGSAIKKWITYARGSDILDAKDLIHMEENLGNVASYGVIKKGVFQAPTDIPNPAMNNLAKQSRKLVSGEVDKLAEKVGEKGFAQKSTKISSLLKRYPDIDPTRSSGSLGGRLAGSMMAGSVAGPLVGASTYLAETMLNNPGLKNALFNLTRKPIMRGIGTASKLALSELPRNRE